MSTTRDPIEALCADFDGTLAQTRIDFAAMRRRVVELAQDFGLRDGAPTLIYVLELISHYVGELGVGTEAALRFERECRRRLERIELSAAARGRPFPCVPETLAELRRRGTKVGIVTRNSRAGVQAFLRRHPLPFDTLVTRDDVSATKPHPEHLWVALRSMGYAGGRAVMVGDHPTDMQCATAAGLEAIGVLSSGSGEQALRAGGAVAVIPAFGDLLAHFG